jgi:hypothetical protein
MPTNKRSVPEKPMVIVVPKDLLRMYEGGETEVDPGAWYSRVGGVEYVSSIARKVIESSPNWIPSMPLPLSPDKAIARARKKLPRFVKRPLAWTVTEIILQRLCHSQREHWFYVVNFTAKNQQSSLYVCVAFNGTVGSIKRSSN